LKRILQTLKRPTRETMILCELCTLQQADQRCSKGLNMPKKMKCPDFNPGIERFCAVPEDYKGPDQLHQMASFFGLQGKELKRVHALKER
jgi:hypothetical protein